MTLFSVLSKHRGGWLCVALTGGARLARAQSIAQRQNHPVVQVTWNDAQQYCAWAGKRLPTESEWERAARGGLEGARFLWGDELTPRGRWQCNIWQGEFPHRNTMDDGFLTTAPVKSYRPNGFGLYQRPAMCGNGARTGSTPTTTRCHP